MHTAHRINTMHTAHMTKPHQPQMRTAIQANIPSGKMIWLTDYYRARYFGLILKRFILLTQLALLPAWISTLMLKETRSNWLITDPIDWTDWQHHSFWWLDKRGLWFLSIHSWWQLFVFEVEIKWAECADDSAAWSVMILFASMPIVWGTNDDENGNLPSFIALQLVLSPRLMITQTDRLPWKNLSSQKP